MSLLRSFWSALDRNKVEGIDGKREDLSNKQLTNDAAFPREHMVESQSSPDLLMTYAYTA